MIMQIAQSNLIKQGQQQPSDVLGDMLYQHHSRVLAGCPPAYKPIAQDPLQPQDHQCQAEASPGT